MSDFKKGDHILADLSSSGMGGFSEYAVVPMNQLVLKPQELTFQSAAALPVASVAALQGIRDLGKVQKGEKVLIYGAGGGVGIYATQLAIYYGAHVSALCGTKHVELLKMLGAERVLNYKLEDVDPKVETYDLILAINGNYPMREYKKLLNRNGRCICIGGSMKQIIKFMLFGGFMSLGNKKLKVLMSKPNTKDLEEMSNLVAKGHIKTILDQHFPVSETINAIQYLKEGSAVGKVIIEMNTI